MKVFVKILHRNSGVYWIGNAHCTRRDFVYYKKVNSVSKFMFFFFSFVDSAKNKDAGSIEDLTVNPAERQTKIKARLKKFFHRRPTMEALVKKGIYKGE